MDRQTYGFEPGEKTPDDLESNPDVAETQLFDGVAGNMEVQVAPMVAGLQRMDENVARKNTVKNSFDGQNANIVEIENQTMGFITHRGEVDDWLAAAERHIKRLRTIGSSPGSVNGFEPGESQKHLKIRMLEPHAPAFIV